MSFFGKEFVRSYKDLIKYRKKARLEMDVAMAKLRQVRDELTKEEYYILSQRIKEKPMSYQKIAETMKELGYKDKVVSRQAIDEAIKRILKKLNKDFKVGEYEN